MTFNYKNENEELWWMCVWGKEKEVTAILEKNSSIEVNWKHHIHKSTPLYEASKSGHWRVVEILLGHPHIQVNSKQFNATPFWIACVNRHECCVKLLILDPRVEINSGLFHPLQVALNLNSAQIVKHFIAARRRVMFKIPSQKKFTFNRSSTFVQADFEATLKVIRDYETDPTGTCSKLRKELNYPGEEIRPKVAC
jgi:hypothetical protein